MAFIGAVSFYIITLQHMGVAMRGFYFVPCVKRAKCAKFIVRHRVAICE